MIYLQSGQVLYVRMGQGDTTLPPDCTVYYSKAITVNGRASETDRSVSQADTFDQVQKATTGITDLIMLSGPALPSNDPNVVATGQRYKCRVIIANRDSITRTAFVYVKTGSTDRYILAGLPIPAGHTAYSTIDGFFEVTEGSGVSGITAGSGLSNSGTASAPILDVNVDNSTLEINADTLRVKDAGITYAKIQNVNAGKVLGRKSTSGSGAPEELGSNSPINITTDINLSTNGITDTYIRQGAARSVIGVTGSSTANVADIVAGTDGHALRRFGSLLDFGGLVEVIGNTPSGSDTAGANTLISGGKGTGLAEPGLAILKYPLKTTTGSTVQSASTQNYTLGGALLSTTSSVTVTASVVNTTETTLIGSVVGSQSLEGGLLRAGRNIRVSLAGALVTSAAPVTVRVRVKIGSVAIIDTLAQTPVALSGSSWRMQQNVTINTIGASGTSTARGYLDYVGPAAGNPLSTLPYLTSATFDTTSTASFDVTITYGGNTAGNSITLNNCLVEILH